MAQLTIFQKLCNVCKKLKPFEEFYKHRTASGGLHPSCKECVRARSNAWRNQAVADGRYRLTKKRYRNSEKGQASIKKYELKESSKIKRRAATAAWYIRNRERMGITPRRPWTKERRKEASRKGSLKVKYGISIEAYEELLKAQNGLCAICDKPPSGKGNFTVLTIDHDHTSGAVRGLLCHKCNSGIGMLGDSLILLGRARDYLLAHS